MTFTAGQTTQTITVPITDDVYDDNGEQFTVNLSNATFGTIADPAGIGTILDEAIPAADDTAVVSLVGPPTVIEGDTTTNYTVSVDQTPVTDITVNLTYTGTATDGTDYTAQTSVTIAAGTTSVNFTLPTTDDVYAEGTEQIVINIDSITGGGFEQIVEHATDNNVTTTITDEATPGTEDTALVSIIGPPTVFESDTTTPYTVSIDHTPTTDVTVDLTYTGTATDGTDYTSNASVTFAAGTTSTTFTLPTTDDIFAEGSESIIITIDAVAGGGFEAIADDPSQNSVTTNILDEPSPGTEDIALVSIVGPPTVTESDTTTPYTVSIDHTPLTDVTVTLNYTGTCLLYTSPSPRDS